MLWCVLRSGGAHACRAIRGCGVRRLMLRLLCYVNCADSCSGGARACVPHAAGARALVHVYLQVKKSQFAPDRTGERRGDKCERHPPTAFRREQRRLEIHGLGGPPYCAVARKRALARPRGAQLAARTRAGA